MFFILLRESVVCILNAPPDIMRSALYKTMRYKEEKFWYRSVSYTKSCLRQITNLGRTNSRLQVADFFSPKQRIDWNIPRMYKPSINYLQQRLVTMYNMYIENPENTWNKRLSRSRVIINILWALLSLVLRPWNHYIDILSHFINIFNHL